MKKRVYLQIGPYSSVGGVSIHISRLVNLLKNDFQFEFIDESPIENAIDGVYNIRSKNAFKYLKLIGSANIVHIHTGTWWLRCIHIVFSKLLFKKTIVTIHSMSNLQTSFSKSVTRFFLFFVNQIITVSPIIAEKMKLNNAQVMPAFLPPILENEPNLPEVIIEKLSGHANKRIIVSNAFELVMHKGQDLYGLDMLIDVARAIKRNTRNYFIVFVVASQKKDPILDTYKKTVEDEGLNDVIYIHSGSISFVNLIQKSDVVVRATNTDGDAITVREAMYLERPIIASDVVNRPDGTILFETRNSNDLFQKIDLLLSEPDTETPKTREQKNTNFKNHYNLIIDSL